MSLALPSNYISNLAHKALTQVDRQASPEDVGASLRSAAQDIVCINRATQEEYPTRSRIINEIFNNRPVSSDAAAENYGRLVVVTDMGDTPSQANIKSSASILEGIRGFSGFNSVLAQRAGLKAIALMADQLNAGLVSSLVGSGASDKAIFEAIRSMKTE